jgi:hypothetical protein
VSNFESVYIWPNEYIPFRLYLDNEKLRIFWISNFTHNFNWLKKYRNGIRDNDIFFVNIGTYYHDWLVQHAVDMLNDLKLEKDRFYVMVNDEREHEIFSKYGFRVYVVNNNSWLDYTKFNSSLRSDKKYDAIYVARDIEFKRHELAANVSNLALVMGPSLGEPQGRASELNVAYKNSEPLVFDEVNQIVTEAKCGLILSEIEGACYASSEYLLNGIPVVSTKNMGGRSHFYNEYNSLVVNPDPVEINNAVQFFLKNKRRPEKLRADHIAQQEIDRLNFCQMLSSVFNTFGLELDSDEFFFRNYIHKMRFYEIPDFENIFK